MFFKVRSAALYAAAIVGSAVLIQAQTAIQPSKVAIINAQKAVAETQEIKREQTRMEAKYRPRQDQVTQLQTDLSALQKQLGTPGLPPDKEAQLRESANVKQRQLQRLGEDLQADVNAERQDILSRAGRQMTEVVKKLAEDRGIDVVIDISNTIYYKPALDITADATAAYDKAYPAK
jgi:outer membrane protein